MSPRKHLIAVIAGALVGAATAWAAGPLVRIPPKAAVPQTGSSPGTVFFNHETHVDEAEPNCVACHPRIFPVLRGHPAQPAITHDAMDKGQACGACHGKTAFKMTRCDRCHNEPAESD